jgi:Bacterial aa3 type cytochrome c oxidase subunit IV
LHRAELPVRGRCPRHAIALIPAAMDGLVRLEGLMADHSEVAYTTADGNDYVAHEQTYLGFLMLVKWGTISIIAILVLMAIFLT